MIRIIVTLAVALGFAAPAMAQTTTQTTNSVAAYKDWTVFTPSTDPKVCYIVSPPVSTEARRNGEIASVNRGDIRLFVSFRPAEGVANEVSYTGGYPFRSDSTVDVAIGSSAFKLAVGSGESEQWAWPPNSQQDGELIQAMKRGANAKLTAISSRGTTTIDTFSLLGFTAALEEAERLCN